MILLLFACSPIEPSGVPPAHDAPTHTAPTHAAPHHAAPPADLSAYDQRRPLPLLPMMAAHQREQMRGHLEAVQALTGALAAEDWAAAEAAALQLGTSPQMEQTCTHMGAAAEGFTEQALAFHQRADEIAAAVRAHDSAASLRALSRTLQDCTTCHATWRQEIVSQAEYDRLSSAP